MGLRTAWWCANVWRGRPRVPVPVRLGVVTAVLCTTALLPGQAALAAGTPGGYAFAEGARRIEAASNTGDAVGLEPGATYRSSLPRSGKVYYRLELDTATNAYVSVTAVPRPGSTLSAVDGLRVSVQDDHGQSCSNDTATFGAARSPHPIAAWGWREISPAKALCQDAGTYYVAVERVDPDNSPPEAWDLELTDVSEPRLDNTGTTSAPEAWNSASPEPLTGDPVRRRGGASFAQATPVGQGVWRDDIEPGRTLFYQVPVDWGQQLYATAELSSSNDGSGYAAGALDLALYNPVRGQAQDVSAGYDGSQQSVSLAPAPPVEYANRFAPTEQVGALRFAGRYYLVVHLAEEVADGFGDGPFGLTLRVRVSGAAQDGPGYAGESVPRGVFEVTEADREAAAEGGTAGGGLAMKAVAVGGIGTGSALLLGLGLWTVMARRRGAGL
ncbi:hypothetical protein [Streptomyces sp. S.PNR 29]|uniref:hypothetical protein n=1 Tax=Streptomyces sp. S.PNR 29 TaxID=2973805 RepID=UPI0025B16958|nr:hypothetical protein [Streptomyces sp. S.PNR 29]MDN0199300.1 hypothetical protein [Streptomyces sp. S.PNR 29]